MGLDPVLMDVAQGRVATFISRCTKIGVQQGKENMLRICTPPLHYSRCCPLRNKKLIPIRSHSLICYVKIFPP